jgi:hypothetical protein
MFVILSGKVGVQFSSQKSSLASTMPKEKFQLSKISSQIAIKNTE